MSKPIPWPVKGDETFSFLTLEFNVTYALEHLVKDREPNARVRPTLHGMSRIDTKYALGKKIDLTKPVLVADLGAAGRICIDGNHRSYRAEHDKVEHLPAHLLTQEETMECCITRPMLRKVRKPAITRVIHKCAK